VIYIDRGKDPTVYQGDIYAAVPFVELNLWKSEFYTGDDFSTGYPWSAAAATGKSIAATFVVAPMLAMVIGQDCDLARPGSQATLCVVDAFATVFPPVKGVTSPERLKNAITKSSKVSLGWFYLPVDATRSSLSTKQATDFRVTTRLSVRDLGQLTRVAGLNNVAREHLRHRVAYFFQRYPVDEWYSLDKRELDEYRKENGDVEPFAWQLPNGSEDR
jgi:hypothetical protein